MNSKVSLSKVFLFGAIVMSILGINHKLLADIDPPGGKTRNCIIWYPHTVYCTGLGVDCDTAVDCIK